MAIVLAIIARVRIVRISVVSIAARVAVPRMLMRRLPGTAAAIKAVTAAAGTRAAAMVVGATRGTAGKPPGALETSPIFRYVSSMASTPTQHRKAGGTVCQTPMTAGSGSISASG